MDGWKQQDMDRFMATIVDIGATFAVPQDATKEEWQQAKSASTDMYDFLSGVYGDDIQEKLSEYYAIRDNDYQAGRLYMEAHPEVSDYLKDKNDIIVKNPILYKYYGSLQTIESYYNSQLRAQLEEKHGKDIFQISAEYSSIPKTDAGARKQWTKDHPKEAKRLYALWDDFYAQDTQRNANEAIVRMYDRLPQAPEPLLREAPGTAAQQAIVDAVSGQQVSSAELVNQMPDSLQELIANYWSGDDLPDVAIKELEYIGGRYNLSANDILLILQTQPVQ